MESKKERLVKLPGGMVITEGYILRAKRREKGGVVL